MEGRESVQHTPERAEHSTQGLPYFTNMSNNVTNNYPTSVLKGDLSPRRHLTACSPCHEVGTTTIHRPLALDQRHTGWLQNDAVVGHV